MKKFLKFLGIFLGILLLFSGSYFLFRNQDIKGKNNDLDKHDNKVEEVTNVIEKKVNDNFVNLSLDEKIAQMLIISYNKTYLDDTFKNYLETYKPGGFILFSDNISTYDGTLKLINDIKNTANIPMFIAIDQEGGRVQRLKSLTDINVTDIPSMLEVGKTNDPKVAYDLGVVIAEELRALGINMDFAPVIDVIDSDDNKVIGNRSFGKDKYLVAKMGVNLAKGLEENNVIAVYKHFPGHGSTIVDSHYYLPVVNKNKEELLDSDLVPFKEAIKNDAEVIMTAHLALPNITNDDVPASLSKVLVTDLLKKELGYNGLVVTDALNMKALTNNYSEQEIYELAINAGVDILLMPNSLDSAINLIKDSISKGNIKEEQIDSSVKKILKLKYKKLGDDVLNKNVLGNEEHKKVVSKINEG